MRNLTKFAFSKRGPLEAYSRFEIHTPSQTFTYPDWQSTWAKVMEICNEDLIANTYTDFSIFGDPS